MHDRTGNPLVAGTLEDDLDAAVRLGAADALVLTGKIYAGTHELIATARRVVGRRAILVGGGVTASNVREVQSYRGRRDCEFVDQRRRNRVRAVRPRQGQRVHGGGSRRLKGER